MGAFGLQRVCGKPPSVATMCVRHWEQHKEWHSSFPQGETDPRSGVWWASVHTDAAGAGLLKEALREPAASQDPGHLSGIQTPGPSQKNRVEPWGGDPAIRVPTSPPGDSHVISVKAIHVAATVDFLRRTLLTWVKCPAGFTRFYLLQELREQAAALARKGTSPDAGQGWGRVISIHVAHGTVFPPVSHSRVWNIPYFVIGHPVETVLKEPLPTGSLSGLLTSKTPHVSRAQHVPLQRKSIEGEP